jgi:hypothetical protein
VPDDPRDDAIDELDDAIDDGIDGEPIDDELDGAELIANARRRHGAVGGILAAGMLGLDQVLGRKPKEEIPVVVASNSDPVDIDAHGIVIDIDDDRTLVAPPLPRAGDQRPARKRAKRRRAT